MSTPTQSRIKEKFSQNFKKVSKSILENLKNFTDVKKSLFEQSLSYFDSDPEKALRNIRTDQNSKRYYDNYFAQFYYWAQSFPLVLQKFKLKQKYQNFNISDKLISIQSKVKGKQPKTLYVVHLTTFVKKQLQQSEQFIRFWRQERDKLHKIKTEKEAKILQAQLAQNQLQNQSERRGANKQSEPIFQILPQQKKQAQLKNKQSQMRDEKYQHIQKQKQKEKEKQKQIARQNQKKRIEQKNQEIQKFKMINQQKFRKNRQARFANLVKYMQSRKQFSFGTNRDGVAKQILFSLQRFMKDKMEKILMATKIRLPGYNSQEAGDQFRLYSSKSNLIQIKNTATFPESDIRILKVKYPSKLERYLKLRVQQQKQQQRIKNQMRQKMQTDKKTDKFIQSYVISDQKQNIHTFERDQGPKKRQRLAVPSQIIQYVLQNDSWFNDSFVMESTFYRSSS